MITFVKLLFVHLLADFVLQPTSWAKDKSEKKIKSIKLYLHVLIHAVLSWTVLGLEVQYLWYAGIILITHWIIDLAKVTFQTQKNQRNLFFIDQMAHFAVLIWLTREGLIAPFKSLLLTSDQFWLLAVALLSVTWVGAVVIKLVISRWSPSTEISEEDSLESAGKFIGILERLFVFGFVVTNNWEAVGFLLAAKSVFRFGDLRESKDRKLTEYILIGTLLSFGLATSIAMLYKMMQAIL